MSLRMSCPSTLSLAELVEHHADFVWRSLRRLGVPHGATDDATQQVFLIVQSKLDAILPGREKAFLFGIALNVAAHARRTQARRREVDEEHAEAVVDPSPLPDAVLEDQRARLLLDAVLDGMETDLRTVFVMFELEQLTKGEIASLLGLPEGTVASRLRRARAQFHEHAQRLRARMRHAVRAGSHPVSFTRLALAAGPDVDGGEQ